MNADHVIRKPTLLLNRARTIRNIARMAAKAKDSNVRFRPHFKTHKSAEVGEWFRNLGVECIAVSSVDMALYFAAHGWEDIAIVFPVNLLEIEAINTLARRVALHLLVAMPETVSLLSRGLRSDVNVWIEIDTGHGRTGLPWDSWDRVMTVAKSIQSADNLCFAGLSTHAGHSYHMHSKAQIIQVYEDTLLNKVCLQA